MKHTKILATFGPACASTDMLKQLVEAGVNAFRVNCSHGETSDFIQAATKIREATAHSKFPVGLLFDISGPKLRLARFDGELTLRKGDSVTFTSGESDVENRVIGVNHPAVLSSVKMGERLLVDDGNIVFDIKSADGDKVAAEATNSGAILSAKGINLPDTDLQIPTITQKDMQDIKTAVEVGADFIALSFVRSGDDIIEARQHLKEQGGDQRIIAKLEKREAIDNLEEIMILADGVMVARGDLGVELPAAELPLLQKRIIRRANQHQMPVIVATQMLESMRFSPRATRAEINDVASAVFDAADAVMLSAETATGSYPLEAVQAMAATIAVSEQYDASHQVELEAYLLSSPIPHTIAAAVTSSDKKVPIKATFALTASGHTAALMSCLYSNSPIIALSSGDGPVNRLTLHRSVYPVKIEMPLTYEDTIAAVNEVSATYGLAGQGDVVIITGGLPIDSRAPTNFMMLHVIT